MSNSVEVVHFYNIIYSPSPDALLHIEQERLLALQATKTISASALELFHP